MLDTPEITETADQLTATIHLIVPASEIQVVMGPGIHELMATIAAQGIAPAGPWFTHHLRVPSDVFDFEIGVTVKAPVTASGRVKPGLWPAMTVARTVYSGAYEGLKAAWGEFGSWIVTNGHKPAEDLWERYVIGPESGSDSTAYRTELIQPLVD